MKEQWRCRIEVRAQVRLGCEAWEREQYQPVIVKLELSSERFAAGGESDRLSDTVDYCSLANLIATVCSAKEFSLVEHLVCVLKRELAERVSSVRVHELSVCKPHPPVPWLGPVEFVWRKEN